MLNFTDRFGISAAHCWSDVWPKHQKFSVVGFNGKTAFTTATARLACWSDSDDGPNKCDVAVFDFGEKGYFAQIGADVKTGGYEVYEKSDELGKTITFVGWAIATMMAVTTGSFEKPLTWLRKRMRACSSTS